MWIATVLEILGSVRSGHMSNLIKSIIYLIEVILKQIIISILSLPSFYEFTENQSSNIVVVIILKLLDIICINISNRYSINFEVNYLFYNTKLKKVNYIKDLTYKI